MKHFLSVLDRSREEILALLDVADEVKADPRSRADALRGKTLALVFEKSSTRTRVSFEVGMLTMGGSVTFLSSHDAQLGRGESAADTARVLSRYVDGIMLRTFGHDRLVEMAENATVPVINGLTESLHPCQALADLQTLRETFGSLDDVCVAYVGDGNNVATSLMLAAARVGVDIRIATAQGYEIPEKYVEIARADAAGNDSLLELTSDPREVVDGAHCIYTDVWTSMGHEDENAKRLRDFVEYSVDTDLMAGARDDAIFLHCLPCHRGEEVTADVVDGPQSRVFDLAENRMHVQKAVLLELMADA